MGSARGPGPSRAESGRGRADHDHESQGPGGPDSHAHDHARWVNCAARAARAAVVECAPARSDVAEGEPTALTSPSVTPGHSSELSTALMSHSATSVLFEPAARV